MKKKKRLSTWLIILLIAVVGGFLIWTENPFVHQFTTEKKLTTSLTVAGICILILLCDDLFLRLWNWLISISFLQRLRELSGKSLRHEDKQLVDKEKYRETLKNMRLYLRHNYDRAWPRKLRILLVTGSVADFEQLTPKLTQELWQEDQGTLLLWGGDPAAPADAAWLTALRKLRRRPVDGVVWVTSAFDRLAGSDTELAAPLTPESMDALAHALKGRYDALGWKLPLYVWSLHPRAGEQLGRITQPVGCQLSAASKPEALARQLSDLIPALTAQGVQQICDKPQQSFLLALADQLTREPETLTGPLSVLLNPYRPLPLAGVVFSPATVGGVHSVAHHWGKDNRWDAIPASAQALPAGLRPRKHGVSWTQMVGVSVTALMALWVISMAVSFVANRSLVTMAQEQVQQSVAEKQPLSARLHAPSELQKTLARLQYRAQHGVTVFSPCMPT